MNTENREREPELERRFKELYIKSISITEYITKEERQFVENNKDKFKHIVDELNKKNDGLNSVRRSTSETTRWGHSSSANIGAAGLKAKLEVIPKETKGVYHLSYDLIYQGDLSDGLPNGEGSIVTLSTGALVYQGFVKNGVYNGKGKLYRDNLLYEEGEFKEGIITEGIRYLPNGSIYSGFFNGNRMHGDGRIVTPCGFYIEGKFVNDVFNSAAPCRISYPSALYPKDVIGMREGINIRVLPDFILIQDKTDYCFYFNGDVFVGNVINDKITDGILYKYNKTDFIPMVVGQPNTSALSSKPTMVVEGQKYKYFKLM